MENITNTIFVRFTPNLIFTTDIACTYTALVKTALDDIKWSLDKLAEDSTSTYAKELYTAAIATIRTATVMLLRAAYPHKIDVYTAASKVLDIKCKRLGIKKYV